MGLREPASCLGTVADSFFGRGHDADHPGEAVRLLAAQPPPQALPVGKRAPWDDQLMKFGCAQSTGLHYALNGFDRQPGPDRIVQVEVGPDVTTESLPSAKVFSQSLCGHSPSSAILHMDNLGKRPRPGQGLAEEHASPGWGLVGPLNLDMTNLP